MLTEASVAMPKPAVPMPDRSVTCPFCGLLCDDLAVEIRDSRAEVVEAGCARAQRLFPVAPSAPARVDGRGVDWHDAASAAAGLLRQSRRPLIGGLGCDIAGLRAAVALAERADAWLDHMDSAAQLRNLRPYQDSGWIATTLSEVRNRADVIVLAGTTAEGLPRFFERCLPAASASQFGDLHRRVMVVGSPLLRPAARGAGAEIAIDCPNPRLAEVFGLLRARLAGRRIDAATPFGVATARIDALLAAMRAARYGVLAWDAAELDFPQADLAVRAMIDLVADLNRDTRWSVLPLGGGNGGSSAQQVATWLAGYPLRCRFAQGTVADDPLQRGAPQLLRDGAADLLLWISAFDPARQPPPAPCPTVVLGRADAEFDAEPAVFIPVAVPGVQRRGLLTRVDQIVTLPLAAPAASALPGVAEVLLRLTEELGHAAA